MSWEGWPTGSPLLRLRGQGEAMRDHSHHVELSREDAVAQIIGKLGEGFGWAGSSAQGEVRDGETRMQEACLKRSERVSVAEAAGRVLAFDVHSHIEAPNCLTCCMDSIAVHWDDFEGGAPDTSAWKRGVDWEFANTGVAMPEGFDAAVVVEHASVSEDEQHVRIDAAPSGRFAGTRPAGSSMKPGDLLAPAGRVMTPDDVARIVAGNVASVRVVCKPRVAFIPTGNELVTPGGTIAHGKNIETNSLLVKGKVEQWGGRFVPFDIVPDDPDAICCAVQEACEVADIVVLNAGSSKGSDDWSVEQLEEIGQVICHQTNHGPGHHSSYAIVDATPVVGISGPPWGASFTLNFYLRPLMYRFLGMDPTPKRVPVRLAEAFPAGGPGASKPNPGTSLPGEARPPEATDEGAVFFSIKFLNVENGEDGTLVAHPAGGSPGSSEQRAANAYYMMPSGPGAERPAAGDVIRVEFR